MELSFQPLPGSPAQRDFPVLIVQDTEICPCSFFPSCPHTFGRGRGLPQLHDQQTLAAAPFPAVWGVPGELPAFMEQLLSSSRFVGAFFCYSSLPAPC